MENVNVFQIIMPKKAAKFSKNRMQWTISGNCRNFQDLKGSFWRKISAFGVRIGTIQHGMLYRQIVMALGGPFANPLREDLDVHHVVQADGAPLTPDSLTPRTVS